MKCEKVFKRFLKENSLFNISLAKETVEYSNDYDDFLIPLNSFRWETTEQGHMYWFEKSLEWVMYLYGKLNEIDEDDKIRFELGEKTICETLGDLLYNYTDGYIVEEDLNKSDAYKKAKELYDSLTTVSKNIQQIKNEEFSFSIG